MSKIHNELKRAEESRHGETVISAGLSIKGEISGNEDILVEGLVEGPIQLNEAMLTIGATGRIASDVVAREVIVHGQVHGKLDARDRIEITKEGSMVGDLTTARVIIEDGAKLKGSIEITSNEKSLGAAAAKLL